MKKKKGWMLFNPLSGWVSDSAQVCVCVTEWVRDEFQPHPFPTLADYVSVWQVEKTPQSVCAEY